MSPGTVQAEPVGEDGGDFDEVLQQAIERLKEKKRISYGALKHELKIDDDLFAAIRDEIVDGQQLAYVEDGRVLVWTGGPAEFDLTFK